MYGKIVAGLCAAALATGIGLGTAQLANAEPIGASTPSATAGDHTQAPSRPQRGGSFHIDYATLAEKLAVSEDDIRDAVESAHENTRPSFNIASEHTPKERDTAFVKVLAEKLGIDEAKITAALEELREQTKAERTERAQQVLADAVASETLTREEADAVAKAADAGLVVVVRGKG